MDSESVCLQTDEAGARKKGYIYLILTFTLWGSLYVVSKFVLGRLPAFKTCSQVMRTVGL